MIAQTQAVALQIRPWSKTSHMVTWLTPDYGRIVTAVKGACRPKSAFLGQYDLFYTCDLLFYRREHDGVHAIRECAPVALREALRRDWRRAIAAAYLADLTSRAAPGRDEAARLFGLLEKALDRLSDGAPAEPLALTLWYEAHLLRLMGLQPDFSTCPQCHTSERPWMRFSLPSGRLHCPHRSAPHPREDTVPLHLGVQRLYLALSAAPEPPAAGAAGQKNAPPSNLLFGLSRFLGMFIAFHLDAPSVVRRVALELYNTTPTR